MDYLKIFKDSFKLVWRNKSLWILGFLLSLGGIGIFNFPGPIYQYNWYFFDKKDKEKFLEIRNLISQNFKIFIIIGVIILFLFLLFLIIGVIAQGGLIGCINNIRKDKKIRLIDGLKIGWHKFWSILSIRLFLLIIFLFSIIISLIIVFGSSLIPLIGMFVFVFCLIVFFIFLILAIFILNVLSNLSSCICIVDDLNFKQSLSKGWSLFKKNWKDFLIIMVLIMVVNFLLSSLIIFIILFLVIFFGGIGLLIYYGMGGLITIIYSIIIILLILIISLIYTGFYGSYITSIWTLSYLEIQQSNQLKENNN